MFLKMVFILLLTPQFYGFARQKDSISQSVKDNWRFADSISNDITLSFLC